MKSGDKSGEQSEPEGLASEGCGAKPGVVQGSMPGRQKDQARYGIVVHFTKTAIATHMPQSRSKLFP